MAVSKQIIKNMITQKMYRLSKLMTQEFGGNYNDWLLIIQNSGVYNNMLDAKTHMWSEGDMYLRDCLVGELKEKGVLQ